MVFDPTSPGGGPLRAAAGAALGVPGLGVLPVGALHDHGGNALPYMTSKRLKTVPSLTSDEVRDGIALGGMEQACDRCGTRA